MLSGLGLAKATTPDWLQKLVAGGGAGLDRLDVDLALRGSVFVPWSGLNRKPWRHLAGAFHSFVYVDEVRSADDIAKELEPRGYELLAKLRLVIEAAAVGNDGRFAVAESSERDTAARAQAPAIDALWVIYRLRADLARSRRRAVDEFSLLAMRHEPLSAYSVLYQSRDIAPACVTALPSPDTRDRGASERLDRSGLVQLVMQDPDQLPVLVLHDGSMDDLLRPFGYMLRHVSTATGSPDHATLTRVGPEKPTPPPPPPPPQLREAIEGTMRIVWLRWGTTHDEWEDAHVLVVAEEGFSMLNGYTETRRPELRRLLSEFAEKINFEDEPGTLYPAASISAIPRRHFRAQAMQGLGEPRGRLPPQSGEERLRDFRRHIASFLNANRRAIRASKVLVDLHVSPEPVSADHLRIVEELFRQEAQDGLIRELAIVA